MNLADVRVEHLAAEPLLQGLLRTAARWTLSAGEVLRGARDLRFRFARLEISGDQEQLVRRDVPAAIEAEDFRAVVAGDERARADDGLAVRMLAIGLREERVADLARRLVFVALDLLENHFLL